jgi:hypothetical protein
MLGKNSELVQLINGVNQTIENRLDKIQKELHERWGLLAVFDEADLVRQERKIRANSSSDYLSQLSEQGGNNESEKVQNLVNLLEQIRALPDLFFTKVQMDHSDSSEKKLDKRNQKSAREIAELKEHIKNFPVLLNRANELERSQTDLIKECEEYQLKTKQQKYIQASDERFAFYNRFRLKLTELFLILAIIKSNEIDQKTKDDLGKMEISGEFFNIAGGFGYSSTVNLSLKQMGTLIDSLSRLLTLTYEWQIKKLTTRVDNVNGGIENLAECGVARLLDTLRSIEPPCDCVVLEEKMFRAITALSTSQEIVSVVQGKKLETSSAMRLFAWTAEGVYTHCGLKVNNDYYKGSPSKNIGGQPWNYGYRLGSLDEVKIYNLIRQETPTFPVIAANNTQATSPDPRFFVSPGIKEQLKSNFMKSPLEKSPAKRKYDQVTEPADSDKALREELRKKRKQIADTMKKPAFVVFADTSLDDMVAKKPKTLTDFFSIKGVGQYKLKKYGQEFLDIINKPRGTYN